MSSLFKLFTKKKIRKGPSESNQSMIDFIADDISDQDSFRSHQPHLNSSLADLDNLSRRLTEASPTSAGFPITHKPKANITSVFNTPKKVSIMDDLYDILQEHVIDQLGEMIMYNKKPQLTASTHNEKIQSVDFEIYIAKLKNAYEKYRKMNASRLNKARGGEQINFMGNLNRCYEQVPGLYFEEKFIFNFKYLTQEKAKVMGIQEQLGDYLDLVEENLYYQITNKFQAFLDVILKLNQMELQIQNSLYSIRFLRSFNADLKNTCSDKVTKTLRLKRRKINIEKTLAIMELLNVVKKTLPTLVQLIHKNNIDSAVKLVKTSEETYRSKLNQVKALKNFNVSFNEARNTLEKMLNNEFEDKAISYFTPAFAYNKTAQHHNMSIEISMVEESFMNVSTVDLAGPVDDDSLGSYQLYWSLNDYPTRADIENHLAKIVLEFMKIKNFTLTTYKAKLFEFMKKTHKQFINDMNEYMDNIQKEEGNNHNAKGKFDLNIKFALFYFELFKRFLTRHFRLNNKILSTIINYYNTSFADKQDADLYRPVLDVKSMKTLVETVQEFYLALGMIFKHFLDKFTEIIGMIQVGDINANQFAKLRAVFDEFISYFNNDLKLEKTLNSWIVTDKESIRKPLLNLVATLYDKFSLSPIQSLKIDYEKKFISLHYKQKNDELRQSLEQETWLPADIPYTYGIYFNIIFGIKMASSNKESDVNTSLRKGSDDILRSSRPFSIQDANLTSQLNGDDESVLVDDVSRIEELNKNGKLAEEFYSIKKNEIYIKEKRFKTINSFLLLLRIICEDFNIAVRFNSLGKDAVSSIFDIIKSYNSYCIQLILGAGATTFGKVKKITAKTLALSSVSLGLLMELIDPLHERIIEQIPNINKDWLNTEITKVKSDLRQHINEITAKVRSILKSKLIEQCNELKKMSWGNAQEKVNIPTKYSAGILHNTRQIYKTIEDFLSRDQLVEIFNVIFTDIKDYYLPIFDNTNIESKLAAKRIKEELKYFCDDLYQIPIFQAPELKYGDFEDRIFAIVEEKCNHFLEATLIN